MLNKRQCYLQIALNSTLSEARSIINQIPLDKRIIIEAGTPLIKAYGVNGIKSIRNWWEQKVLRYSFTGTAKPEVKLSDLFIGGGSNPWWFSLLAKSLEKKTFSIKKKGFQRDKDVAFTPYIVADLKCMDRGATEVDIAKQGGADAATALGQAPIETLDSFIQKCEEYSIDSMIDMMNVKFPLDVLRKLKKLPQVVILHRGVDEEDFNREKEIPFHEIQRLKSNYDIMIAVAGGDTFREAQRAVFNDADIVVVWRSFYKNATDTAKLAEQFLKEIR